ncbi:MAG: 50S ribosomal protein L19e [archaeon]
MNVNRAKEHAARILNVGKGHLYVDATQVSRIKESITKDDVRQLIKDKVITKRKTNEQSRGRSRDATTSRKKGRKRGFGKRKGTQKVRAEHKRNWVRKVRRLRKELLRLKKEHPKDVEKIGYRKLYSRISGNFFRGQRYLEAVVKGKKI